MLTRHIPCLLCQRVLLKLCVHREGGEQQYAPFISSANEWIPSFTKSSEQICAQANVHSIPLPLNTHSWNVNSHCYDTCLKCNLLNTSTCGRWHQLWLLIFSGGVPVVPLDCSVWTPQILLATVIGMTMTRLLGLIWPNGARGAEAHSSLVDLKVIWQSWNELRDPGPSPPHRFHAVFAIRAQIITVVARVRCLDSAFG